MDRLKIAKSLVGLARQMLASRGLISLPRKRNAAASESDAWKIVDEIGWANNQDYRKIKNKMMRRFSEEESEDLRDTLSRLQNEIATAYDRWERAEDGRSFPGGDDTFSDVTWEVVGRGKRFHSKAVADPSIVYHMAEGGDYTESFHYAIPSEYDYDKMDLGKYQDWAQKNIDRYTDAFDPQTMRPIKGQVEDLIGFMRKLAGGDIHAFMETEKDGRKLSKDVKDFYINNIHTRGVLDGGNPYANEWSVWNLYSDISDFMEVTM